MKEPDRHQLPSRPGRKRSTRAPGAVSRIDQVRENQSIDCRARAQWERATARTTAAVVHACASRSPGRPGTVRIDGRPRAWIAIAAAGLGRQSPEVGAGRSTDHVRTCAGGARRPTSEPGLGGGTLRRAGVLGQRVRPAAQNLPNAAMGTQEIPIEMFARQVNGGSVDLRLGQSGFEDRRPLEAGAGAGDGNRTHVTSLEG